MSLLKRVFKHTTALVAAAIAATLLTGCERPPMDTK